MAARTPADQHDQRDPDSCQCPDFTFQNLYHIPPEVPCFSTILIIITHQLFDRLWLLWPGAHSGEKTILILCGEMVYLKNYKGRKIEGQQAGRAKKKDKNSSIKKTLVFLTAQRRAPKYTIIIPIMIYSMFYVGMIIE